MTLWFVFTQIRVGALNSEVLELRSQLEDAASVHERELHSLRETCTDLQSRADVALKEVDDAVQDAVQIRGHIPPHVVTIMAFMSCVIVIVLDKVHHELFFFYLFFLRECTFPLLKVCS